MACTKHGYTNNVYCPACDLEVVMANELRLAGCNPPVCEECAGLGYTVIMDDELGEVRTGCFKCWIEHMEKAHKEGAIK